ncbi:signal peptide protein [Salinisphaera shabanensis T35B1]|jgi:uncharacterized protein (DUF2147 family)|uniref:DUF2147 domain-containing protein n=1 Tax=Salinisphaera shabanensis E1L3A TaxID=1033802 RepID=F7QAQ5_9GAMM|nr:DUF2147 domain-containing protein [Salinisphaera shabanensis]ERJ20371.1 hypothetical protein SSPSH_000481 [Salinisphaera shabanensis E1L3A]|tara:strand:+ start:1405 stop:1869 length:465 start_codon:yes stop_codon:yes gene_type:complete
MFKHALLASAMLVASSSAFAADMKAEDAAGVWETASGGYVQLYEEGDTWKGKIVGSKSGKARYDKNNPDESKRDRRLLGITVLDGLKYAGNGEFEGGTIYDPNNGKTYKAKATQTGPDTIEARGYIGISLIGKSQTWKRIESDAENVHQDLLQK